MVPNEPTRRAVVRGFTLIELMLVLVIGGILLGLATWAMGALLGGNRVNAAGRNLLLHVRQAAAIAARTNGPIDIVFTPTGSGCTPRYDLVAGDGTNYLSVCIPEEYPGVRLGGGLAADPGCPGDAVTLPNCSVCSVTKTIRVFPSGETLASTAGATGDSVVFSLTHDASPARTLAVGIYDTSGKARVFRPNATNSAWECP